MIPTYTMCFPLLKYKFKINHNSKFNINYNLKLVRSTNRNIYHLKINDILIKSSGSTHHNIVNEPYCTQCSPQQYHLLFKSTERISNPSKINNNTIPRLKWKHNNRMPIPEVYVVSTNNNNSTHTTGTIRIHNTVHQQIRHKIETMNEIKQNVWT